MDGKPESLVHCTSWPGGVSWDVRSGLLNWTSRIKRHCRWFVITFGSSAWGCGPFEAPAQDGLFQPAFTNLLTMRLCLLAATTVCFYQKIMLVS